MISLTLARPIVFLDVETTGVNVSKDRVVQLGLVKAYPDGRVNEWETLINPGVDVPTEAQQVHGITDARVATAPTFKAVANKLQVGLSGCDVGGYNVAFDLAMLTNEFRRCGVPTPEWGRVLDAYALYRKLRPRNLAAFYGEYVGRELEGAHDALTDVRATVLALQAAVERHALPSQVDDLVDWLEKPEDGFVDSDRKLRLSGDRVFINFGQKFNGVALDQVELSYLEWILRSEFTTRVKATVRRELERRAERRG